MSTISSPPTRRDVLAGSAAASVIGLFPATLRAATGDDAIRPFRIDVPDEALVDLRRRIAATKWPERETVADATQGVPLATIEELARYWATGHDWRKVEARLNALPQFKTEIDGLDIHFIHVRSEHEFQGFAAGKISRAFGRACTRLRRDEGLFAFDCVQPLRAPCTDVPVEVRDRRGDAAGGGGSGEIKAASQLFLQAFPKCRLFSPSFSKGSFGDFVEFQEVARSLNRYCLFSKFFTAPPLFSLISAAAKPYSAASRRSGADGGSHVQ